MLLFIMQNLNPTIPPVTFTIAVQVTVTASGDISLTNIGRI